MRSALACRFHWSPVPENLQSTPDLQTQTTTSPIPPNSRRYFSQVPMYPSALPRYKPRTAHRSGMHFPDDSLPNTLRTPPGPTRPKSPASRAIPEIPQSLGIPFERTGVGAPVPSARDPLSTWVHLWDG